MLFWLVPLLNICGIVIGAVVVVGAVPDDVVVFVAIVACGEVVCGR